MGIIADNHRIGSLCIASNADNSGIFIIFSRMRTCANYGTAFRSTSLIPYCCRTLA